MNATIPLAKTFNADKLVYPVGLSEKYDGVPIAIIIDVNEAGTAVKYDKVTRQGERAYSCTTIVNAFMSQNLQYFEARPGRHTVVGEVHQTGNHRAPFKDTSGIVRRQEDQGVALSMAVFDYKWSGGDELYGDRYPAFMAAIKTTEHVWGVPTYMVPDADALTATYNTFTLNNPEAEGMIARSYDDLFRGGKRSWGYQKMLNEPTIDLWIVGCEEATSQDGEPKGMAGRLTAMYKGETIGIGPGKLTHGERIALLKYFRKGGMAGPRMAKIKYKRDASYTALRQPTFQHWHDGKTEADA